MSSIFLRNITRTILGQTIRYASNPIKMSTSYTFDTLSVIVPKNYVYEVQLNRPQALNAQTKEMWIELKKCFEELSVDPNCRVIIISGSGKLFTAGLDFNAFLNESQELAEIEDVARKAKHLRSTINKGQDAFTCMENCNKPVLAAVHNACVGAGVSLITAADVRYCTKDAWFQVKEILLGMACDVGALQRLPKIVGNDGLAREICYTGRKFDSEEASKIGLVTKVFEDKESMMASVLKTAEEIASNSPVAVQNTKRTLIYSRDHDVRDGLDYVATLNEGMLQSEDFATGVTSLITKEKNIQFSKL